MIELNVFSKSYDSSPAVRDVSLVCRAGTVTGLLGENGAGKTTVLRAVCAQHFATGGSVRVMGIDAAERPDEVRALTGFVGGSERLPDECTVRECLMMAALIHGVAGRERAVEEAAARCGAQDVLARRIGTLSRGYRERVSFARALVHDPPVLVLDEPANGLDPAQIVRMRALVSSLAKGRTVLLSTHLMQEVDALCDVVCVLHKGRAVACGTAEEVARSADCATLEEAFIKLTQDGGEGV